MSGILFFTFASCEPLSIKISQSKQCFIFFPKQSGNSDRKWFFHDQTRKQTTFCLFVCFLKLARQNLKVITAPFVYFKDISDWLTHSILLTLCLLLDLTSFCHVEKVQTFYTWSCWHSANIESGCKNSNHLHRLPLWPIASSFSFTL